MAQNNIGGFFVDVAANVNTQSFKKAEQSVDGVQKSISRLLGFAKTAAPIVMATTAGAIETANLKTAKAIGLSAQKLDQWKTAASVAGVSAGALTSSMSQLESKMQHLKLGQVDANLAKNLGFLGIQYGDFAKMDADQRMRSVFSKANGMQDQKLAAQLVADTLGSGAREYYDYLKLSGKSLDQQLQEAKALNFTTDETKKNAMLFSTEAKAIGGAFKSISTLIGSEIAKQLTPVAQRLKEIIQANHDLIATGITGFIESVGRVIRGIGSVFEKITPLVSKLITGFGGLDKVILKVGIGFAALKLKNVIGNITQLVGGLNLLKGGLAGLTSGIVKGGLFLVLEDLMYYFMGGGSVFGDIINNLDNIKAMLGLEGVDLSVMKIVDAFKKLGDLLGGKENLVQGVKSITSSMLEFASDGIKTAIKLLGDLTDLLKALVTGDWQGAGQSLKAFFTDMGEGLKQMFNTEDIKNSVASVYKETLEQTGDKNLAGVTAVQAGIEKVPVIGSFYTWTMETAANATTKLTGIDNPIMHPVSKRGKINDGIISPDGRITQVAPDDWVLAARNLDDMAAAFIPHGITNNSNVNAPAAYTVNQNITVNGGKDSAQTVKQQAYTGAYKALNETISKGNMRLQQMPGLR